MCDRDESRDTERNRQMPQQSRIQRILDFKQRAYKNRYAQEPGDAANRRCKPRQMNQAPARLRQRGSGIGILPMFTRDWLEANATIETLQQTAKRKNSFDPQKDPDGINDGVINDHCTEETMSQRRREHWLNNCRVVPDVERAAENLWDHRREGRQQQAVTRARRALNFASHKIEVF